MCHLFCALCLAKQTKHLKMNFIFVVFRSRVQLCKRKGRCGFTDTSELIMWGGRGGPWAFWDRAGRTHSFRGGAQRSPVNHQQRCSQHCEPAHILHTDLPPLTGNNIKRSTLFTQDKLICHIHHHIYVHTNSPFLLF